MSALTLVLGLLLASSVVDVAINRARVRAQRALLEAEQGLSVELKRAVQVRDAYIAELKIGLALERALREAGR